MIFAVEKVKEILSGFSDSFINEFINKCLMVGLDGDDILYWYNEKVDQYTRMNSMFLDPHEPRKTKDQMRDEIRVKSINEVSSMIDYGLDLKYRLSK